VIHLKWKLIGMSHLDDARLERENYFLDHKPDLATSRRNFLFALRTLAAAGALMGAGLAGTAARAEIYERWKPIRLHRGLWHHGHWRPGHGHHGSGNHGPGNHGPKPPEGPYDGPGNGGGANCFCAGTLIETGRGAVTVEDLRIGDLVPTVGGRPEPVRWIWTRRFEIAGSNEWPVDVLPVRIAKGALGDGIPRRDLYLSQAHMVYLGGVLIPVSSLVNGRTIAVVRPQTRLLTYHHFELSAHNVVLAEGAPCETLLATQDVRRAFDNYGDYARCFGEAAGAVMMPYAPIASFNGGRSEFKSRMRSALAPIIDYRQPIDRTRDTIESRAYARLRNAA
jgi:Hint domain